MKRGLSLASRLRWALTGLILFILLFSHQVFAANSYTLVTTAIANLSGDKAYMTSIFQKNKLFDKNTVYNFDYNTEAGINTGTTKRAYKKAIKTAYSECTENDTAFFFHTGHGAAWTEGKDGLGLVLNMNGLYYYKYSDLLKELSKVNCKHMVVIIMACHSGAVKKAWNNLDMTSKRKMSVFWSSEATKNSGYNTNVKTSYYGYGLIRALSSKGKKLNADSNKDGIVTIQELGNYLNTTVPVIASIQEMDQQPGYITWKSGYQIYSMAKKAKETGTIRFKKSSQSIYVGDTVSLKVYVTGTSKKVTWSTSDKTIAAVKDGKVTGKKAGVATITAKANGKNAKCRIIVKNTSIKITPTSKTVNVGSIFTIKATVAGRSKKITWYSSNKSVAAVNNGKVTARKAGKATIKATANGRSAKCIVTVKNISAQTTNFTSLTASSIYGWVVQNWTCGLKTVDGQTYNSNIFAWDSSTNYYRGSGNNYTYAEYNIKKQYRSFSGDVVTGDSITDWNCHTGSSKSITFKIFGDGKLLFSTDGINREKNRVHFNVSLRNVNTLRIEAWNYGTYSFGFFFIVDGKLISI